MKRRHGGIAPADRAAAINRLMWDEAAGMYRVYNFVQHRTRTYEYLTTFYPFWAGFAGKEQAARVISHLAMVEHVFRRRGRSWRKTTYRADVPISAAVYTALYDEVHR